MTGLGPFRGQTPDLDSAEDPNRALETGPRDLPIMTDIKTGQSLSRGRSGGEEANYKDLLPNHLLKVDSNSKRLPKRAQTSFFGARKSNGSNSNLQFSSILKFTGKQKIRKGSERGQRFGDEEETERPASGQSNRKSSQPGPPGSGRPLKPASCTTRVTLTLNPSYLPSSFGKGTRRGAYALRKDEHRNDSIVFLSTDI